MKRRDLRLFFRVAAILMGIVLVISGSSFVARVFGSREYPPIPFLLIYGGLSILSLPLYLVLTRLVVERWSVVWVCGVFVSITGAQVWELLSWCTPGWCGERNVWRVAKAQILTDPGFLSALLMASSALILYTLHQRRNGEEKIPVADE